MKLKIVFYDENISWDKNWIFLGSSYLNLQFVEKKIKGPRIQINHFLHESFKEELNNYLQWIENQRIQNNDSVYWWMTTLACKNNAESNFFWYICQITSLRKILEVFKKKKEEEILIVSDDILLIQALIKNFSEYQIKTNNSLLFKVAKNLTHQYYKIVRNSVICLLDIFITFYCSRITLKEKKLPTGNIYLLHQYMEIDSLKKNKNLQTRYFPYLKEYFVKENINLYCLSWFEVFWSGKIKVFKKLRTEKHFIPEDWINLYDYIVSIKNFLKANSCINNKTKYPKIDITHFLLHEKRYNMKQISSNLRFWTYMPAIKKWSKNCESITCIDHYENMIFEHALIAAIRSLKKKVKIYGYHHTLASKEWTVWHSLKSEWTSKFKPDYVISLGSISKKVLNKQGVPDEKIIDGPALRYNHMLTKKQNDENKIKNNIVVILPPIPEPAFELISKVKILSEELKHTDYNFIIQPHPNMNVSKILSSLGIKKLAKNIVISHENLDKILDTCLLTISMSTGAVYDAVLNGNIAFNLRSELTLVDNYLDIFEDNFLFANSHSLESIKNILLDFINDEKKINKYIDKFKGFRSYLIEGMNLTNEQNLKNFV